MSENVDDYILFEENNNSTNAGSGTPDPLAPNSMLANRANNLNNSGVVGPQSFGAGGGGDFERMFLSNSTVLKGVDKSWFF